MIREATNPYHILKRLLPKSQAALIQALPKRRQVPTSNAFSNITIQEIKKQ
jgi:hypothetical protein